MDLKFNSGKGAVLCSHCHVIIMHSLFAVEWQALRELDEEGVNWFCETCQPGEAFKDQGRQWISIINRIAGVKKF